MVMEDAAAKELVNRLNREVIRPDSGKLEMPIEDIQGLRQLTTEIVRLADAGGTKRWGPTRINLNALGKLILTEDQYLAMGTKKADIAKTILDALPPVQGENPASLQPANKRVRFNDGGESTGGTQTFNRPSKRAFQPTAPVGNPWGRYFSASPPKPAEKWLSWPCPLLSDRRKSFLADNQELLRDLRKQAAEIEGWATTVSGTSTLLQIRGKELPEFLQELANEKTPFPESVSLVNVADAYKTALLDRATEVKAELRRKGHVVPSVQERQWATLKKQSASETGGISVSKP